MGINTTLSRLQAKFDDKDAEKGLVFAWWIPLFCVAGQVVSVVVTFVQRDQLTGLQIAAVLVLVLIPERLPIEETARALEQLEEAGVRVGGVVVNRVLPETSSDPFLTARRQQERVYLDEIELRFGGQPRVLIPQLESDVYGLGGLERVSGYLLSA